jgi:LacI family transcriptional regulator
MRRRPAPRPAGRSSKKPNEPKRPEPRSGSGAPAEANGRGSVTIRDVAREASVSVATVSRVLNGKGPVHADTERRIREAAKVLRYVPHGGARSLIMRRTQTIGVLLPDLYGEFFSELIRGIDAAARRSGYHLLVSGSHGDRLEIEAMARAMRGRVDGLVVLSPDVRQPAIAQNVPDHFPVVLLNNPVAPGGFDSVRVDNFGGATAVVSHLASLGHTRIAFVGGPPGNHDAADRLRGYRRALRGAGLPLSRDLEVPGDFREEAGYDACRRLLALEPRPSAVFAANDSMAVGLLYACREAGVSVPEQLAIAGFDDIPIARFITPPLTSVRVPIADLGTLAAETLLARLSSRSPSRTARRDLLLPATLIVRASSGAPPFSGSELPPPHRRLSPVAGSNPVTPRKGGGETT